MALSGRAIAAAARRAGYRALVADLYCDDDTRALADACVRLPGEWRRGLTRPAVLAAADRLAAGDAPLGVVCGAGVEDRPGIVAALARRHRVLGCDAAAIRRVKRPQALAALCRDLAVPHPPIAGAPQGDGWLRKRAGGSGGGHVGRTGPGLGIYWQRRVPGEPVSALVLAAGSRARVLGFSAQWSEPWPDAPFRYAGAVRPAPDSAHAPAMAAAAERLAAHAGLRGLVAVDFVADAAGFHLIEVNPRPGASLDVFTRDPAMMRLHVAACGRALPDAPPAFPDAEAARVVYAPRPVRVPPGFAWPAWAADREAPGPVAAGAPLCTVRADAATPAEARALAESRRLSILASMGSA